VKSATASTSSPRSRRFRPALDKVALHLVDNHARHCDADAAEDDGFEKTAEPMAAIGRLMAGVTPRP